MSIEVMISTLELVCLLSVQGRTGTMWFQNNKGVFSLEE